MNKLNRRSKIVGGALALSLAAAAPAAYAATTAQLTLTGTVQQILAITVTATAQATGLDLTGQLTAQKVASVVAESNSAGGYTVSVASFNQNDGNCTTSDGPCFYSSTTTDDLPFSLLRDAVQVSFSGSSAQFVNATARSAIGGDDYDAQISYDGTAANLGQATDYTETLTFSIVTP